MANTDKCHVCGETQFNVQDGFYYCNECGTQSQLIRAIEIDQEGIEEKGFFTALKVRRDDNKKTELTSWECFNYFLRGLVDELSSFGAKEELKLTVLQLWTHYLRMHEVAFFSKTSVELPRLGPKFLERDSRILYNHQKLKKKRVRSQRSTSEKHQWTQSKKKLAKAEYDTLSQSQQSASTSFLSTSQNSSASAASNRAIRINLSRHARKYYKRFIPKKHLKKHECDSVYELKCHDLTANKFCGPSKYPGKLTRRAIYALLYIALNLIGDDMQLCDLVRFCREGHLTTNKFTHVVSEEFARECEKVINMKYFHGYTICSSTGIRTTALDLMRFIKVKELRIPDLMKLTKRFIVDLRLPAEIGSFIERLYNLHPPKMGLGMSPTHTPCYEGRAMAYILFVLKLLFILDGESEIAISNSAKSANLALKRLGYSGQQIFVWQEWVNYIEMRKVILTQCHYPSSVHFDENVNYDQYVARLKQLYEEPIDGVAPKSNYLQAMDKIFEDLHTKLLKKNPKKTVPHMKFQPSLTPYSSYMNCILSDRALGDKILIPDFMYNDPADGDLSPFIHAKKWKNILKEYGAKLVVKKMGSTAERKILNTFIPRQAKRRPDHIPIRLLDYDISEEDWLKKVKAKISPTDIFPEVVEEFKLPPAPTSKGNRKSEKIPFTDFRQMVINRGPVLKRPGTMSLCSFDLFSEENMEPLPESIIGDQPRQIETESILTNVSDDENEDVDGTERSVQSTGEQAVELKVSNFDFWNLHAYPDRLLGIEETILIQKLPPIFQWLLKTFAKVAEIEIFDLYRELLALENQFLYMIEPLDNFRDALIFGRAEPFETNLKITTDRLNAMW